MIRYGPDDGKPRSQSKPRPLPEGYAEKMTRWEKANPIPPLGPNPSKIESETPESPSEGFEKAFESFLDFATSKR